MKKRKSLVPKWLLKRLDKLAHEEFWLLSIHPRTGEVFTSVRVAKGTNGFTPLDPPFKMVELLKTVTGPSPTLVLVHNHPSRPNPSSPLPSVTDLGYFLNIYKVMKPYIVDVVITHDSEDDFSFKQRGIFKCYDYILKTFVLRKYNVKVFQLASYLYFTEYFSRRNIKNVIKLLADNTKLVYRGI